MFAHPDLVDPDRYSRGALRLGQVGEIPVGPAPELAERALPGHDSASWTTASISASVASWAGAGPAHHS